MLEIFKSINLDKNIKAPLYVQLQEKLQQMISGGLLTPGLRLPSVRELSKSLAINQITVVSAYRQLEEKGLCYSKPGSGIYVENNVPKPEIIRSPGAEMIADELYINEDIAIINGGQVKVDENTINFASATPASDLFPVDDFKTALNEVLERDKGNAFAYQESQGYMPLLEGILDIVKNQIRCGNTESIQVISGAQQGIDLISKALLKQGDCVIAESPTYKGAVAVFRSRGAEVIDIAMEDGGPNMNIMEYQLKKYRPRLIYSIPSFQNPTGFSYTNENRKILLELAERYNAYVIEDGYVSDLDFENRNLSPLKQLDKNDRVIYIKSFSKIFMPGLRLGFMVVPHTLKSNILEAKHTTDISTSGLIQRAFDVYIRKGFWNKHMDFMYNTYKQRYMELVKCLDSSLLQGITYTRPGGGLNVWLNLPYGFPVNTLLLQSAAQGVVFAPGRIFYGSNSTQKSNNIRLSFAAVDKQQISRGIETLCSIAGKLGSEQKPYTSMPIL
ncbi:MAG TPA: PLP-dependent aminotransferase family protein [Ruminiclostridium sp.]|nr:PLP-dependent aminotransferase family protein [Ruminiclostridium sp.]